VAVQGAEEVRYCYRHPDRETMLSCSECGRPICAECVNYAPVGLRCPDHSGKPQGVRKVSAGVRSTAFASTDALVTKTLIGINVLVYFMELATGGSLNGVGGTVYEKGALIVGNQFFGLAAGEWWRLVTAGFLHAGLIHLGFNMLLLWWFGSELERGLGRLRFLAIYFVSLLAGSAGAILLSPQAATVGASGAVFGLFGAAFILERQAGITRGPAFTIIVLNLVLSFVIPGISIGGHIGGLVGGALSMLALTRLGRVHAVYGKPGLVGVLGVAAVGVASLVVAWLQVQSYT
jgi:membrane associated rhomboid family serine protease